MAINPSERRLRANKRAAPPAPRGARIYDVRSDHAASRPAIANMRVTFWGVQGSCPIFPSPDGMQEYSRRLALDTLKKTFEHLATQARDGKILIEEVLGGPPTRANIAHYQKLIGLPDIPSYGGETTCVQVETSEGNQLIFDAGTGLRRCSLHLVERWKGRKDRVVHLFGSHEHLDHRAGIAFARFCYVEPCPYAIHVYGSGSFLRSLDIHYGVFSKRLFDTTHLDDPMDYTRMPAVFNGFELRRPGETGGRRRYMERLEIGKPVRIGATTVTPFEVYHVIPLCLGYKVEHNGKTFVFCTDHELRRGDDPEDPRQLQSDLAERTLREHCRNADLAYFDGQYTLDEYLGADGIGSFPPTPRIDWGHGCIEDAVDRAQKCNIRRTLIGHHDPERAWPEREAIDRKLAHLSRGKTRNPIHLADSDMVIDL